MKRYHTGLIATVLAIICNTATLAANTMTKEQAIEKAIAAHPGEVIKAYQETKKGVAAWEVKIKGTDGKSWEIYYAVVDGALLMEEQDDD